MSLFQLPITRVIQVYIVQGFIFIYFSYLIFKIYKGERDKLKTIFSGFYITVAAAFFVNFIYAPLTDLELIRILNFITNFCLIFAPIFLMVFCLTSFKGEENVSTVTQLAILISYGVLVSFMAFIPDGVVISSDTGWLPKWSLAFFIYVVLVGTVFAIVPTYYFSVRIYKIFENEHLRKKWKNFIIGLIVLTILWYGTMFSNTLHNYTFRTIWAVISLVLALSSSHLIFHAIASKME